MDARLDGIHTPLVTPFTRSGAVDVASLERLARHCLKGGAAGLVALGTTGEAALLDGDERRTVLEVCRAISDQHGTPLIVGAGTMGTEDTIRQARERAPLADALLVVVPYYLRPADDAIVDHFAAIGAAVDVPILPYDVGYRTGKRLSADTLRRVLDLDGVAGIKFCPGAIDHDALAALAASGGPGKAVPGKAVPGKAVPGKAVLCGDDPYVYPMLQLGAAGAITASAALAPHAYIAMAQAVRTGDAPTALSLHNALLPMVEALFSEPAPAVLKAALAERGLIDEPGVRAPLRAARPEPVARALAALEALPPIGQGPP
jgi:dihydrodipicolinate synthase/N-acetylneuraminate lyase